MKDVAGKRYRFLADLAHDEWVTVYGGDLPVPVDVRIGQRADGRFAFTGLRIGVATREEVTANVLRKIRLAEILADYWDAFPPVTEPDILAHAADMSRALQPGRGPDEQALRAFAMTYTNYCKSEPHRAMTLAARAHNISRATAHRWAALCRERGYLPGEQGRGASS